MPQALAAARRVSRLGLWFGGALVLLAAVLIGVDVLLRRFLDESLGGADELSGYAMAIGFVWALPATLLDRGHIRIDSLYVTFPIRLRVALDIAGVLALLGLFGLVAWHGYGVVAQSWVSESRSQSALAIPTIIPQAMWWAGLLFFLAVCLVLLGEVARLLGRGDLAGAVGLIGTRSAEDEVGDEIRGIERRRANG